MTKEPMYQDYLKNAVSCGTVTMATVSLKLPPTCFAFTGIRETDRDMIIPKSEWERFLKFLKMEKSDKPCSQQ